MNVIASAVMNRIVKLPIALDMMIESCCRELSFWESGYDEMMVMIDGVAVFVYSVVKVVVAVVVST